MAYHLDCYSNAKGRPAKDRGAAKWDARCAFASDGKCLHGGEIRVGERIGWASRGFQPKPNGNVPVAGGDVEEDEPEAPEAPVPPMNVTPVPGGADLGAILAPHIIPHVIQVVERKVQEVLGGATPEKIAEEAKRLAVAAVDDALNKRVAREIVIKAPEAPEGVNAGIQHKQFDELLALVRSGNNVVLVGEAGTGKTTAVENVFAALKRPLNMTGAISDRHTEILGFIDASGTYHPSLCYDSFAHGKGFLVDEFDGSDERELLSLNAATANGRMAFPCGMVEKHPDCQFLATGNTWGTGANAEYTGRARLDASSLDRFVFLYWEIDENLERQTCPNSEWVDVVQIVRKNVKSRGMKHLITPRASYHGAKIIAAAESQGMSHTKALDLAMRTVLRKGLDNTQWSNIRP